MTDTGWSRRTVATGSAFTLIAPLASERMPASATPNLRQASWTRGELSPGGIVATEFNNLGLAAMMNGQLAKAEELHRTACTMWKKYCPSNNTGHSLLVLNLSVVLSRAGRYAEAKRIARRALARLERAQGANSPTFARGLRTIAAVLADAGCSTEAEAPRRALEVDRKWRCLSHPDREHHLDHLAMLRRMNDQVSPPAKSGNSR